MVYKLFTVILQVFGNSCLVEKFCSWEIPLKPSLHGSVTFLSTCLLLLSLYNCCCILGRFSHRNTRSVCTFLEYKELHKDEQYLHVCIHHRCHRCHGSSAHQQGGLLRARGYSVAFVNPHLGESISVWHALHFHSRAAGTGCAVHGPVGKGKVRPRSELLMCYEGL